MKIILVLIYTLISFSIVFSQNKTDVLAKIGDKTITVGEFKFRYELSPQINRKYNDDNKAKEEFLYTIIAEKLFSLEAEKKGFDTLDVMRTTYIPLEKMHVRDALYKSEIKDSVVFNNDMFTEGMKMASHKLFVDYLYSQDKDEITKAYNNLKATQNFDSLAPLITNVEYQSEPYEVIYGQMFPEPETEVFKLNLGEFTHPLQSPDGWYIFRLLSKIPVSYTNSNQKVSAVKKIVEGRNEDSIYNEFWSSFFKNRNISTDGALYWYLVENLQSVVSNIKENQGIADGEKIMVSNEDFVYLKNHLNPDSLKKVFIRFDKDPITLDSFINDFMFEGFYTFTTDVNTIANQIKSRVKRQIELELLARYGYEKGYESLPEVKSSTNIWRDNYLSTLYKKDFVKNSKLTDGDLKNYFKDVEKKKIPETKYKIIEVLTDDLEVVREALQIANNDSLFKKFSIDNTKRESTKKNDGEFDYFTASEFEEIGKVTDLMKVGDIYGPLQTKDGYSVFKLIDKKESNIQFTESEISEDIKNKILYNRVISELENNAANFAEKYKVTINESLLNSLELLNAQMIVYRYMGFGGKIIAFPYSSPFYKWKKKWEQKKKDLL